jgi:hypothetical protein
MPKVSRRGFLKALGLTGTAAITSCSSKSARNLIPYIIPPEDIIPGEATWYATACRQRVFRAGDYRIDPSTHSRMGALSDERIHTLTDLRGRNE